ncbi:MAG: ABC transporter permease [Fidelibacterota bacterium]|nr:MAG: ABC transporter permease [Candidatus Neomarinimicrobiota bacterium]
MNNSWFLARRLLFWRQERRKLNRSAVISVAGVAAGSAVLILSLSILNGFEADVWDSLLRFEQHSVLLPRSLQVDARAAQQTLHAAGIITQPYAERKLVVQSGENYRLATARIVTDLAEHQAALGEAIMQNIPYPLSGDGVIIGALLADRLDLMPGDEVRLLSPLDISLAVPRPPQLTATIQAVYEFGILNFDEAYIFIDFNAAERLIPRLSSYAGLSLVGTEEEQERLLPELIDIEEWELRTWETDHVDLLTAMRMEKLGSAVVLFLIILVASFNATSTMVMSVMEKYREIGILRSLGASRRFIKALFLRQGLLIGLVGVCTGVGLGVAVALCQMAYHVIPGPEGIYAASGLPMELRWIDVVVVLVGAIIMSLGAAWYPARYATSIPPGQAVNYEK